MLMGLRERAKNHQPLVLVGVHLLLLAIITSTLYGIGLIRIMPDNSNITSWDVHWYNLIRRDGYFYLPNAVSSVAFFPLFPYFWRFTHLEPLGIGLLNAALFLVGYTWLAYQLRLAPRWTLLLLSTPTLLFMIIPYSEALFFCFAALLVAGLHREKTLWLLLGLLGCGVTRSASTMFTPALLFMVLMMAAQPEKRKLALHWGVGGLFAIALSVGIVVGIQWYQTGEMFGFVKAQEYWGHRFFFPFLPLFDTSGVRMLWINALGILLGTAAAAGCTWLLVRWLRRGKKPMPVLPPAVIFSMGYFVSVTFFLIFYQRGNIFNAARYLFAPPFFVILVHYLSTRPAWSARTYFIIALVAMLFWQVFGVYTGNFDGYTTFQGVWYFGCATAYMMGYFVLRQVRWKGELTMLLYTMNIVIQVYLLEGFLQYYLVQ